ncbi:MAG: hypothetical protein FJ138_01855 [Deltaproteobacteria bacterium]|nr:hypothetical protein [Deltaproteobacteria bacterium]
MAARRSAAPRRPRGLWAPLACLPWAAPGLSCDDERQRLSVYGLEERYALRSALRWSDCELSGAQLSAEGASGALKVSVSGDVVYLELAGEAAPLTATLCRGEGGAPRRLCLYGERVSAFPPSALSAGGAAGSAAGSALSRCEARVSLSAQEAPSEERCCAGGWESALEVLEGVDGRPLLRGAARGSLLTRALSAQGEALTDEASAARCGGARACGFEVTLEGSPQ